ncbi:MAG: nucleoside triphosphate pyrophosphohydrolase [Verrucomicrobiaceae bacterium]|nr:nucleoside triphosphate pyrophosphohydrolase [Verrucomicrobiaceae bacterium]
MPLPIPPSDLAPIERLRAVVHCLRAPGGCPWDREQTHESLIPHLIEEAYEVAEALQEGDPEKMADELGDLLLQPVLHAEIASEGGTFDLDKVAGMITEKLIRRHPHVFGDSSADSADAVLIQWDAIKQKERGEKHPSALDGVTRGLPALMRAQKLQKKAAKVGFDWPDIAPVLSKIREETSELEEALTGMDPAALKHEVGDLLFSVVNLARKLHVDAESALAATNARFISRFEGVESHLRHGGKALSEATLEEMDAAWEQMKRLETQV